MPARTRTWNGKITVDGGRFLGVEKCWISPGHGEPQLRGDSAHFDMLTSTQTVGGPCENASIFQFEASSDAPMRIVLNGLGEHGRVAEFAESSRVMWFVDECIGMLAAEQGIQPYSPERMDVYHHVAFKAKLHRPIPASGYTAELSVDDDEPLDRETHYRIRVEQRNGQRAWSSPVWVRPSAASSAHAHVKGTR